MRLLPFAPLLAATALIAAAAAADVGPPPSCGAGTHHEYLYGHHCVPDGSHLEKDPAGGTKTVPDNAAASPPAPTDPTATGFASPPPSAGAATDSVPLPAAPPAGRGCACSVAETRGGGAGILAAVAALAAFLRRRRAR